MFAEFDQSFDEMMKDLHSFINLKKNKTDNEESGTVPIFRLNKNKNDPFEFLNEDSPKNKYNKCPNEDKDSDFNPDNENNEIKLTISFDDKNACDKCCKCKCNSSCDKSDSSKDTEKTDETEESETTTESSSEDDSSEYEIEIVESKRENKNEICTETCVGTTAGYTLGMMLGIGFMMIVYKFKL